MRILLKVLLFPLTLFLTLLVAFCRFFCLFSGMVLSIAAMVLFLLGLVLLFCGETRDFLGLLVLAWLGGQPLRPAPGGKLADGSD